MPPSQAPESRYAIVDASAAPLVHVKVVGPLNDATFADHLRELEQTLDGLPRFALILEQGPLRVFPIRFVRQAGAWIREAVRRYEGRWVSTVYVITQPPLIAVVRGLFWAIEHPMPLHVVSTFDAARAWSVEQLDLAESEAGHD